MNMQLEKVVDVLIVLGTGVYESRRRACYAANYVAKIAAEIPIVASGGKVNFSGRTEAEYIAKELESRGIRRGRIHLDNESYNTHTNLQFARRIIESFEGIGRIGIVTGKVHMRRAKKLADEVLLGYEIIPIPVKVRGIRDLAAEFISLGWEKASYYIRAWMYGKRQ